MDKEFVLDEIRRTAEENGGAPLGVKRFTAETGIREKQWKGRFWARWGDAVTEAGYAPNEWGQDRYAPDDVFAKLCNEIRAFGRVPTEAELELKRRRDRTFPTISVFRRALGPKAAWPARLADFCRNQAEWSDVLTLVEPLIVAPPPRASTSREDDENVVYGVVYLAKSGRHYKVGRSADAGRRRYDLAIQLPQAVTLVHEIRTDDPVGIEAYWHRRFADRRMNGEWFALTQSDVSAFRRRKFM